MQAKYDNKQNPSCYIVNSNVMRLGIFNLDLF